MRAFGSRGGEVAALLAGAWRKSPPRSELLLTSVTAITPLLLASGVGALGWWRLRHSGIRSLSTIQLLRDTYLKYAIYAAEHERQVIETFRLLRSAGVEPILIKGWAIARAYPEIGLRPSGDIDLCVAPQQHRKAQAVISTGECQKYSVDLDHDVLTRFSELEFEELFGHSELVNLGDDKIRLLGAEDHLRFLCLHLLKHGAWRPLWLCDIAAAVESTPSAFDWDRCLGANRRRAEWIACVLALASELLGAELRNVPVGCRAARVPGWLLSSVRKQWSAPYPPYLPSFPAQIKGIWWKPDAIFDAIRRRWPNPIQATVDGNGQFDSMPRLPFQLLNCIARATKLCLPGRFSAGNPAKRRSSSQEQASCSGGTPFSG
jgi:Uncharacterised nucleotidyltransferase